MTTIEIASYAAAVLLAASRLLTASEPLWSFIPTKIRWLPPVLVAAIPEVVAQLGGAKTTLDLVTTLIVFATLVVPGARSATHVALAKAATTLLLCFVALGGVSACTPALEKEALGAVDVLLAQGSWGSDGGLYVDQVVAAEAEHFAAFPDAVAQAALDLDIGDARAKLQKAIQDTASKKGLTLAMLTTDYAPAVLALEKLADDSQKLGLFKSPLPLPPAGVASSNARALEVAKPDAPPLPLCVRHALGEI